MHEKSLHLYAEIYVKYEMRYGREERHYGFVRNNGGLLGEYERLMSEFTLYTTLSADNLKGALKESKHPFRVGLVQQH